jgi:hypothetical protein
VAVAALVVVAVAGEEVMTWEIEMRTRTPKVAVWKLHSALLMAALFCALGVQSDAAPQSKQTPAQSAQQGFATPEQAAQALIQATASYDVPALLQILGPEGKDLVASEDPVADKSRAAEFAESARQKQSVKIDAKNRTNAVLSVGNDDWPLPIPIVRRAGKWYFDSKAGLQEILIRRIGQNELDAIQICRGYVEAQHEYALQNRVSGLNEYAQRIISTPGKHDGLAWQNPDGSWGGPVGEAIAKALEQGYESKAEPFHGYFFKVLKGQGPAAPLGEIDFVVNGAMIGGFALAAAPAQYRVTGVQTFIVSHDGVVYEKDLGPDTLSVFKGMERYNPDKTWRRTDDQW